VWKTGRFAPAKAVSEDLRLAFREQSIFLAENSTAPQKLRINQRFPNAGFGPISG
jgi:hypothetical protein